MATTELASSFLTRNGIKHRMQNGKNGRECVLDVCPACGAKKKLHINDRTWLYQCFKCKTGGREFAFKKLHGLAYDLSTASPQGRVINVEREREQKLADAIAARIKDPTRVQRWSLDLRAAKSPQTKAALAYLRRRGFTDETIKRSLVGWTAMHPNMKPKASGFVIGRGGKQQAPTMPDMTDGHGWLTIPFFTAFDEHGEPDPESCAMVKLRNCKPDCDKGSRYMRVSGGESILYQPRAVDLSRPVIVVGGEFDALSALQLGLDNVVAVCNGEGSLSGVAEYQLDDAPDIVIAFDNDSAGATGARKVAVELGSHRCLIATLPSGVVDWNEALCNLSFDASDARRVIETAVAPVPDGLSPIADTSDEFVDRVRGGDAVNRGVSTGIDDLDDMIGGLRRGEVIYVSGTSGSGKSTLVSQIALYRSEQGDTVLFAPIELGRRRAYAKLIRQQAESPPDVLDDTELRDEVDTLNKRDIYFFYRRGKFDVEAVRNTLVYACRRLRADVLVIDHIHFMALGQAKEREFLDEMMGMLTDIAVEQDVIVIVVGHPKKIGSEYGKHRDNGIVQMDDAKGSSGIGQLADVFLSVWRPRRDDRSDNVADDGLCEAAVYAVKMRSEYGREGGTPLKFWPEAARFYNFDAAFEDDAIGVGDPVYVVGARQD